MCVDGTTPEKRTRSLLSCDAVARVQRRRPRVTERNPAIHVTPGGRGRFWIRPKKKLPVNKNRDSRQLNISATTALTTSGTNVFDWDKKPKNGGNKLMGNERDDETQYINISRNVSPIDSYSLNI